MKNIQVVTQEEHRDIHLHDDLKTYQAKQTAKALAALHTIQDICCCCDCNYCLFSNKHNDCLIRTELPNNWEIGEFKKAKLLR